MSENPVRIPAHSQILSDPRYNNLANLLRGLNAKWKPHDGQIEVGSKIFVEGARRIFLECGRKWGKTDWAIDCAWRLGNMIQGGQGYYFAARAKAVREIIWASNRIQSHGPSEYIKEIHKTEMRLTFTSDTFVKLDGADEFAQSKGFNPDFVILDEFADYANNFWYAMSPNFASKDAIVIIISSPPWLLEEEPGKPVLFIRLADLWDRYQDEARRKGKASKYVYLNQPTHKNPYISKEWLEEERKTLVELGEEDLYDREYMAKRVVGGGKRVIGTFDRTLHVHDHEALYAKKIQDHWSELEFFTACDPGNSTVFATLVFAVNRYTKEIYFLDEIYCKQEDETTEHIMWPKIESLEANIYPTDINADSERFGRVYDEEAKWWQVGVSQEFGINFMPSEKGKNSREYGISILRSIFRYNKGYVSSRCKWFAWELENWRKDGKGRIPKMNDHLIDASRYGIHFADYFLLLEDRDKVVAPHPREQQRLLHQQSIDKEALETLKELSQDSFGGPGEGDDFLWSLH
jgi:hypothetical protein